jgi:hypothetical protein
VPAGLLPQILFLFGIGFLVANLKVVADLVRFQVRKSSALLIWKTPKPRYYNFSLMLAGILGCLLAAKIVQRRPADQWFGEAMMLLYYGYALPLSTRIARGFYRDGVWSDGGFMRWAQISAVTWKEDGGVTLILISRLRRLARRLQVPGDLYGEARRVLRDKVKTQDLSFGGSGLGLGTRDESDAI